MNRRRVKVALAHFGVFVQHRLGEALVLGCLGLGAKDQVVLDEERAGVQAAPDELLLQQRLRTDPLELLVDALEVVVELLLQIREDVVLGGGGEPKKN